jgi:hypothetical protein
MIEDLIAVSPVAVDNEHLTPKKKKKKKKKSHKIGTLQQNNALAQQDGVPAQQDGVPAQQESVPAQQDDVSEQEEREVSGTMDTEAMSRQVLQKALRTKISALGSNRKPMRDDQVEKDKKGHAIGRKVNQVSSLRNLLGDRIGSIHELLTQAVQDPEQLCQQLGISQQTLNSFINHTTNTDS